MCLVFPLGWGWGGLRTERQREPLEPRPLDFEVGVTGMGQSPGSRFLCLGPRTHTVRTKGASFCFKAPAAKPPHRNISATATLDRRLLSFLLTHRRTGQTPRAPGRSPCSLHTHSTQAPPPSSGWALDSQAGQLRQGKGKSAWRPTAQARCSAPHCDWPARREAVRMCLAALTLAKTPAGVASYFPQVGGNTCG